MSLQPNTWGPILTKKNVEGREDIVAGAKDIVHVPRNTKHTMITVSQEPSIRLSISLPDVKHFFVEEDPVRR